MKIHVTGFTVKEKEDFVQKIAELKLICDENFTVQTNLLICDSIFSQKYRMAKIFNVQVVKKNWLIESHRLRVEQDRKNYEFGTFEGLKMYFFGFDVFKFETFNEIAAKNNGIPIKDLTKVLANEEKINFIIVKEGSQLERLFPLRSKIILVYSSWFYNCLKYDRFVYPDSFLLPFCNLTPVKVNIKIKLEDLDKLIDDTEYNSDTYNILPDTVFYLLPFETSSQTIQPNFQEEEAISTRLVVLMNGNLAQKKMRNVTHVVTNFIDEEQKESLLKNGDVYFVNYSYLKDCLLYKKRVLEIEYPPKITESKNASNGNNKNDSKNSNANGFLRNSRPVTEKYSITFKSFLFENVLFFFDANLKLKSKYHYLVFENSGSILIDLDKNAIGSRRLFYVVDDGFNETEITKIKESLRDKVVSFISPRWIDFCIETKSIIKDVEGDRFINLLPFQFSTPFSGFEGVSISLKGFEQNDKMILTEVIKIMGGSVDKLDPHKDDQIKIFQNSTDDQKLMKNAKDINWIFACLQKGEFVRGISN